MIKNSMLAISKEGFHHIAYTEWGYPTDESAVICVHGLTRNGRDFDALASYLSKKNYHVFCPDVVGRGESSWFKDPHHYNNEQYILDMTSFIARTNATFIDWIGTSMGGLIGMMIAALPDNPIRRLIMNDVGPQVPVHALWRLAKYAGKDPDFRSKAEAKEYFKQIYADFGNLSEKQWSEFTENSLIEMSPDHFVVNLDPAIKDARSHGQLFKEFFTHPHKALEGIWFDVDLWSFWQKITCPVLVIHGRRSDLLLPEHIRKMQRLHPETDVLEIEDAGHAPALLNLAEHKYIADWLDGT